jgi:hypothetical protein
MSLFRQNKNDPYASLKKSEEKMVNPFFKGKAISERRTRLIKKRDRIFQLNNISIEELNNQGRVNTKVLLMVLLIGVVVVDFILAYSSLDVILVSININEYAALLVKCLFSISIVCIELGLANLFILKPHKLGKYIPYAVAGLLPLLGLSSLVYAEKEFFLSILIPVVFSLLLHSALIIWIEPLNTALSEVILKIKNDILEKKIGRLNEKLENTAHEVNIAAFNFTREINRIRISNILSEEEIGRYVGNLPRPLLNLLHRLTGIVDRPRIMGTEPVTQDILYPSNYNDSSGTYAFADEDNINEPNQHQQNEDSTIAIDESLNGTEENNSFFDEEGFNPL